MKKSDLSCSLERDLNRHMEKGGCIPVQNFCSFVPSRGKHQTSTAAQMLGVGQWGRETSLWRILQSDRWDHCTPIAISRISQVLLRTAVTCTRYWRCEPQGGSQACVCVHCGLCPGKADCLRICLATTLQQSLPSTVSSVSLCITHRHELCPDYSQPLGTWPMA